MFKRLALAGLLAVVVVVAVWASLVVNYEDDLGTDNTVQVTLGENLTGGSSDGLATLSFEAGAEPLLWSSLTIEVDVDGTTHACGFGAQSADANASAKVQPRLGADGLTFTTVVDATDEASFTHFSLPHQKVGNESNHTMRFSKTDVFLGSDVSWAFIEDASFEDIADLGDTGLSNDTTERLEWYDYDLAVHRVNPKTGVYVLAVHDMAYKVQFVSYYNDDDQSRHPTMRIAALNSSSFPALSDPALVSPSPCLILAGDEDSVYWNATENIELIEHDIDFASAGSSVSVTVAYEGRSVRIVENQV